MMQIYRGIEQLPAQLGPNVVTIGNFDGVHCGHRFVIARLLERARELNAQTIAVTLDPHPAKVLRPERPHRLITPLARKLELLEETGLDAVLVLPFSAQYAHTTAEQFARTVLRDALHAVEVHEGENFRFGYRAESDVVGLTALGEQLGFSVQTDSPQQMRGGIVSSSRIRTLIREGNMAQSRALLGHPFSIDSTPAKGRGYGSRYTVPTINLAEYSELLPANGVYITRMRVGDAWFDSVTNVGNRPTFGADSFAIESYLLDFHPMELNEDTPLRLEFLKHLRAEMQWPNPEALKAQIGKDVARAQRWIRLRAALKA